MGPGPGVKGYAYGGGGSTAVERTGSIIEIGSNANSGSQSISVPSDAELIIVAVSGFYGDPTPISTSTGTLTLASVAIPIINEVGDGDAAQSTKQGMVIFGLRSPATGTQTLAWDWGGTETPDEGQNITVGFYKGVASTGWLVDTGGEIGNATAQKTTGEMTADTGDISICVGDTYTGGVLTWGNGGTKIADGMYNSNYFELFEGSLTGNVTVTMTSTDSYNVLGCVVIGH